MKDSDMDFDKDISDTVCLEMLSHVAEQLGMAWSGIDQGRTAEAVSIARSLHRDLQRLLDSGEEKPVETEPIKLTELELDVLKWAAIGKGAAVTAQIMGITERSVRKARETAGRKLNSNSVLLSVATATRLGML